MSEKLSATFTAFDKSQTPGETRITFNVESAECERVMGEIPIGSELSLDIVYRQALPEDAETIRTLNEAKDTLEYCLNYVGGQGLSAEDDCNDTIELIDAALSRLSAAKGEP
jgi:hypothetical protein